MGRVGKRLEELANAAHAFSKGDASLRDLCEAALRYAAAVVHNRKSRDKLREKQWVRDEE